MSIGEIQEPVTLSPSQQRAVMAILNSPQGTFHALAGPAGTGKSTVLREIRQAAKCLVVAPTGIAAINVHGQSIHSFFKMPLGPITSGKVSAIGGNPWMDARKRAIENCDLIAIDERSMVRADLMDGINWSLQKTLRNKQPFGGKKILAIGDDWQLEPVVTSDEGEWMAHNYRSPFWFDAKVFNPVQATLDDGGGACEIIQHELTDIFRQSDPEFIEALNMIRIGDPAGLEFFNFIVGGRGLDSAVHLTYTNKAAEAINAGRMAALGAEQTSFEAEVLGEFGKDQPAPQTLALKVGAQIMVTRNLMRENEPIIANGAVGEVVGFFRGQPVVELRDGRVTAIERITWEKITYGFDLETNQISDEVKGSFSQYPLKPAWAVTTHKAQGQTLESAILELDRTTFAHGQLYVALSRAKTLAGLFLKRPLTSRDLVVNARVREFAGIPAREAI